ncbi:MAG: AraC family transcriptional regulator [Clostridia bacterium]|nr:AraC family transcriptional regulator [Clostridia bacterium]
MNILKQLNDAISYIEQNLCDEIDVEKAAQLACISKDSFLRFFSYMTDMTLTEYIRKRKLTQAAYDLQNGKDKVIDIAVKYGYESADAFSRAFSKQHGISPSSFRKNGGSIKIYPPASFHITIKGAKEMNFRIVDVPETEVYGVSREFGCAASERFEQEHIMWADTEDFVPRKISDGFDGIWYGIWDSGRYAIARNADDTNGTNLEKLIIPAGTYAAFTTAKGGYAGDELPRLRDLIFNSWLEGSGYKQKCDFELEVYHLATDREERRKNRYYEIWIPIEKG